MGKQLQLSIPKPCHENWDQMSAVDKGRFCDSCQKQVVDFSDMSDRQLAAFFKKPSTGSVCGRFMEDQLDRKIEIPKKRIPWLKYFFTVAIPAFLVSCRNSHTVGKVAPELTEARIPPNPSRGMVGFVFETSIDTSVEIIEEKMPVLGQPKTGNIPPLIHITVGELRAEVLIKEEDSAIYETLPGVVVTSMGKRTVLGDIGFSYSRCEKKLDTVAEVKKPILPAIVPSVEALKVYPNPVINGTSLHVLAENFEPGYHQVHLVNLLGQIIKQDQIWIDAESKLFDVEIPRTLPGSYFLNVINKQASKRWTGKIIIQ